MVDYMEREAAEHGTRWYPHRPPHAGSAPRPARRAPLAPGLERPPARAPPGARRVGHGPCGCVEAVPVAAGMPVSAAESTPASAVASCAAPGVLSLNDLLAWQSTPHPCTPREQTPRPVCLCRCLPSCGCCKPPGPVALYHAGPDGDCKRMAHQHRVRPTDTVLRPCCWCTV